MYVCIIQRRRILRTHNFASRDYVAGPLNHTHFCSLSLSRMLCRIQSCAMRRNAAPAVPGFSEFFTEHKTAHVYTSIVNYIDRHFIVMSCMFWDNWNKKLRRILAKRKIIDNHNLFCSIEFYRANICRWYMYNQMILCQWALLYMRHLILSLSWRMNLLYAIWQRRISYTSRDLNDAARNTLHERKDKQINLIAVYPWC